MKAEQAAATVDPAAFAAFVSNGTWHTAPHLEHIIDRLRAHSWAQNNCLKGSIQGIMKYSVGENLVGYLIETLGCEGFLATLSDWSLRAWFMIDSYQGNWRESLELPTLCPLE